MKKKDGHVPHVIHCRGCERNLIIAKYRAFPDSDTPHEYIDEIVDPTSPMFSVRCPCGLYTVFGDEAATAVHVTSSGKVEE